jgi:hypothetical protein
MLIVSPFSINLQQQYWYVVKVLFHYLKNNGNFDLPKQLEECLMWVKYALMKKILCKTTILLGTLFFNWITHVPLEMFAYLIKNILNFVKHIKVIG